MITSLEIRNFKSIQDAEISFSNLAVVIGANASGKSNLIRSLDFLASVARSGLSSAVTEYGNFGSLVPKAIPRGDVETTRIAFKYHVRISTPLRYPLEDSNPPGVTHELEIAFSPSEVVRVASEQLVFHNVLAVARALDLQRSGDSPEPNGDFPIDSTFTLRRGPRGGVSWSADPPVYEFLDQYLTWFGYRFLRRRITTKRELQQLFREMTRGDDPRSTSRKIRRNQSFIDPDASTLLERCQHFSLFKNYLAEIRRFDLLLGELRKDQPVNDLLSLTSEGTNMPSVIRRLRTSSSGQAALDRILSSMGEIAPHIDSVRSNSLRTRREFVEFTEDVAQRPVESWESADGTLRALAILLALETHPRGRTILIEEPEQNLHPWAVRSIVDHIRSAIENRRLQVILATHSPQVLERVEPDEVLVAERTPRAGTQYLPLSKIVPQSGLRMGDVADLWVRGLLKGVP